MAFSAIARIESYKHYQAGAVHKEAVRQLTNYKNPNYHPELSHLNHYFERMELDKPFEQWIYEYREKTGIKGRYIEHSKNPKNETNCMCQALFCLPGYIQLFDDDKQIEILKYCYDFFKQEFPNCTVLEAVVHADETERHLQVNFLPEVIRDHSKRGQEKILSTTLLMPGKDYFTKFQDRFYSYMSEKLDIDLERKKGSKIKHLSPKEYREVTSELKALEEEKSNLESTVSELKQESNFWKRQVEELQRKISLDSQQQRAKKYLQMEQENKHLNTFLHLLISALPFIGHYYTHYMSTHIRGHQLPYKPPKAEYYKSKDGANFGYMDWKIQRQLDDIFGTDFAEENIRYVYSMKKSENIDKNR